MNKKINKNKKEAIRTESEQKVKDKVKVEDTIVQKGKDVKVLKDNLKKKVIETDDEASTKKIRIKVIGVGGGGSNIVFELSKRLKDYSSQKIDFVAANTDNQALNSISRSLKTFSFGNKVTSGLGCGSDVSMGERASQEDLEKIKGLFSDNKDLYIIVSSLGGGTGTGAAPVFSRVASELKLPVISIFTLPFVFEGRKKNDAANQAIEKLKEDVNAYMVMPNEKIFSLSKEELSFPEALSLLNNHLANCLEGLFRTIYNPGLINIDWADIKTVLEGNKKIAYLDVVKIKNTQNLEEFAKNILKNPIFDYNFENADNLIFNIESSKDLSLNLLSQISEKISVHVPNARIIFGLTQNPKLRNEIRITIFSTISDSKNLEQKEPKALVAKAKPIIKDGELSLVIEPHKKKEKKIKKKKEPAVVEKVVEEKKEEKKVGEKKEDLDIVSLLDEDVKIENSLSDDGELFDDEDEGEVSNLEEEKIIRRNALETKEMERLEREQEDNKEKMFDIPAFMRKEKDKKNKK
ncbi:MAG: cell division protein FtsZ [Candidatus Pacebacteria bacterium]|nr:cell division protein FtsZ [Candidatus Paceibacterota bacterium]